jgi:hypothetical protein
LATGLRGAIMQLAQTLPAEGILPMTSTRWLSSVVLLVVAAAASAEVKYPPPPAEYDVSLRFQIRAPLPSWYDRFDEMMAELNRAGFTRESRPADEPEDPSNDRLDGTVSSGNARKLLAQRYMQTIILRPKGYKAEPNSRVKVRLELAGGLPLDGQQMLHRQVAERLTQLGFREMPGYDHKLFHWVLGTIDSGRVDELLRDVRTIPAGWLVPRDPVSTLPLPLRSRVPIKVIEVLPEPADFPPAAEPPPPPTFPEGQGHLAKLAPDLLTLAKRDGDDTKVLRVEVVLATAPPPRDANWERLLRGTASSVVVEGIFGNVATVLVKATQAGELARPGSVVQVRLPRSGEPLRRPPAGNAVDALATTRLREFHQRGQRGQGIKVVVVNGDFSGLPQFADRLPRSTKLLDLTVPRNPAIVPDPVPAGEGQGTGVVSALAVHLAAPDAELLLVRVPTDSPEYLLLLAQLINEPGTLPRLLDERYNEIQRDRTGLDLSRTRAVEERRRALAERVFDPGAANVPEMRKRYQESEERIQRAEQALKDLEKQDAELIARTQRFLDFKASLAQLRGTRVVVCPLTWDAGYALDGANPLSRYIDEKPFVGDPGDVTPTRIKSLQKHRGTVWVQAGGDSRGQTWTGLFRDVDRDGAMEFASLDAPVPPDRWSLELSFLGWQGFDGAVVPDLPAKSRVRVTLQWSEPHDPEVAIAADDPYRNPVANLNLLVLKQRDPTGTRVASDEMEVIARTYGTPARLQARRVNGVYETWTEFDAPAGGRFAVRIEGSIPESIRPAGDRGGAVVLKPDIRPRLFVEVVDPDSRGKGRVVFQDYNGGENWPAAPTDRFPAGQYGGVGMPADAHRVLAVGAAAADGKPQFYSSVGAGPNRVLLIKPELLGFDHIDLGGGVKAGGSWVAASFNAGAVACLLGSNAPADPMLLVRLLLGYVQNQHGYWFRVPGQLGAILKIPESWVK